ncbi:MAG: phosphotransferase [Gloeocapsa sp. UFS-A4-WI-NPMV-4B04]|jgi:aminoglycoside 2''-phosphotransferase|nr:phosphotransferase [Gloeocapsa sp. UFS-A4-WI-NPMV-4B04]
MNKLDTYEQRIRDIFPEISIENISINDEGFNDDIIIVNETLIFCFPKHEHAVSKLDIEVKLIELIRNYVTLDIPKIFYKSREVIAYFMIHGVTLRRDILIGLDQGKNQLIAEQLATFLKELHSVPIHNSDFDIPIADVPSKYNDWVELYDRIESEVFPHLMLHTREWAKSHFESFLDTKSNFEYEPKLIHGDIGPYHILFDRQKNCINGVIDFGSAGLGDPAMDIATIIHSYGESFLSRFSTVYPEISSYLKRARFYAETFELQWALSGINSQDITWFLGHLGSAKDIKYHA